MMNTLSKNIFRFPLTHPYLSLGVLFFCHLFILWPGELSGDSEVQYREAVTATYTDMSPFIMSFVWRYLDMIYKGSGMMLLLHLGLLYGALFYFIKSVPSSSYWFLVFPLIPQVSMYSGMIWKDVGFAFSFLFVGSVLTYYTLPQDRKLNIFKTLPLIIILVYGTLVKFQAQYLAPIMLLWITYLLSHNSFNKKFIVKGAIIGGLFYGTIFGIIKLGPQVREAHFGQLVKFYDLAAISYDTQQDLFPSFIKTPNFTMELLNKKFNRERVDDLERVHPIILKKAATVEERHKLWHIWKKNVLKHPLLYLKHRALNLSEALFSVPKLVTKLLNHLIFPDSSLYKVSYWFFQILGLLGLAYALPVLLNFCYLILGLFSWNRTRYAVPLFFLNAIGSMMTGVIFFCSMAGTRRYLYITICMVHVSHLFAYKCWKSLKKNNS